MRLQCRRLRANEPTFEPIFRRAFTNRRDSILLYFYAIISFYYNMYIYRPALANSPTFYYSCTPPLHEILSLFLPLSLRPFSPTLVLGLDAQVDR